MDIHTLTLLIQNNAALKQLPYNGKKTVPAALRKDLWRPLCQITVSNAADGLRAMQALREYRKLHELSWPDHVARDANGRTLSQKARGRKLCDQKANSVADMAAALKGKQAEVKWSDLLDAEFAESWPEGVVHSRLERVRNGERVGGRRGSIVGAAGEEQQVGQEQQQLTL